MILVSLCAETIKPVFEGDKICQYIMYRYDNIRNNYSIIKCPIPCTIPRPDQCTLPPTFTAVLAFLQFSLSHHNICRVYLLQFRTGNAGPPIPNSCHVPGICFGSPVPLYYYVIVFCITACCIKVACTSDKSLRCRV